MSIETTILSNLVYNEEYTKKVLPFIKPEYFSDHSEKLVFSLISEYVYKYNKPPSKEALYIDLENQGGLNEDSYKDTKSFIEELDRDTETNEDWLLENTEKYCQERAVYNALMESISIHSGKDKNKDKGSIPQILAEALAVSFDSNVGHDFLENFEGRYAFYHRQEEKIPFHLDFFNRVTRGGVPRKTLNICLASTGVGKTMWMTDQAANNLIGGYNVLYITAEMAEERIAERIDANLMNVTVEELSLLPLDSYTKKIARVKSKVKGKLIIKEYPTSSAGVSHFRHLLQELRLKKNFIPDIIYVDYLNICASSRMKMGNSINSYTYIKSIAEELRGLAVETNTAIFTATQSNRDGYASSDVDLANTSESFGVPATADFMFALISTEELEEMYQLLVKVLKNRYGETGKKFIVGIDRGKMQIFDADDSAQDNLQTDQPKKKKKSLDAVMDNTDFGERQEEETKFNWKKKKKDFSGFTS